MPGPYGTQRKSNGRKTMNTSIKKTVGLQLDGGLENEYRNTCKHDIGNTK